MSFDTKLPDHYKQLQRDFDKLNYERLDLEDQLRHTEPCECSCDGCQSHCQGYAFEDNYDSVEDLEKQLKEIETQMTNMKITMQRLERYAKHKKIELPSKK